MTYCSRWRFGGNVNGPLWECFFPPFYITSLETFTWRRALGNRHVAYLAATGGMFLRRQSHCQHWFQSDQMKRLGRQFLFKEQALQETCSRCVLITIMSAKSVTENMSLEQLLYLEPRSNT